MAETQNEAQINVGDLVENLTLQLGKQVRTKPHPLLYINLGLVVSIAFACGVLWQRLNTVEVAAAKASAAETLAVQVSSLQTEFNRLADRIDRYIDQQKGVQH